MKTLLPVPLGIVLFAGGMAGSGNASAQDADATYDGLVRSDRRDLKDVWLKPGIVLSHYTGIILEEPKLEFQIPRIQEDRRFRK
jgi:hypothetical protein